MGSPRSISWPALSELVTRTAGDTSVDTMRAFCRDAGEAWARQAIEHADWILGGDVDARSISVRAGNAIATPREARAWMLALRGSLLEAIALREPRTPPPPRERFTCIARMAGGGRIRNRRYTRTDERYPSADFLARLVALFGDPRVVQYEGFSYSMQDSATGEVFEAYSGPTGPAYGASLAAADVFSRQRALGPTLDAFDRLLDETPRADFRIAFEDAWEMTCAAGKPRERWFVDTD